MERKDSDILPDVIGPGFNFTPTIASILASFSHISSYPSSSSSSFLSTSSPSLFPPQNSSTTSTIEQDFVSIIGTTTTEVDIASRDGYVSLSQRPSTVLVVASCCITGVTCAAVVAFIVIILSMRRNKVISHSGYSNNRMLNAIVPDDVI